MSACEQRTSVRYLSSTAFEDFTQNLFRLCKTYLPFVCVEAFAAVSGQASLPGRGVQSHMKEMTAFCSLTHSRPADAPLWGKCLLPLFYALVFRSPPVSSVFLTCSPLRTCLFPPTVTNCEELTGRKDENVDM